jgi:putative transposase
VRGNARQFLLETDADRAVYLGLLSQYANLHGLVVLGYCLMSNHVHLIALQRGRDSMAATLKHTHGRYAVYYNARHASSGHVWQGRYYSCPLDSAHIWPALRYVELNPVRARLVAQAEDYPWSSAAVHCGCGAGSGLIDMEPWQRVWTPADWQRYLLDREASLEEEAEQIRASTHTGRPLGTSVKHAQTQAGPLVAMASASASAFHADLQ